MAHLNETARFLQNDAVSYFILTKKKKDTTLFIFLLPQMSSNMNHFQTFPPLSPRPHQSPTPLDHRTGHWPTSRCVIEGVLAKGIPALFFPYKYRGPGGEREERKLKEYPRREGESYFLKLKEEGSLKLEEVL